MKALEYATPVLSIAALIIFWEVMCAAFAIPAFILPSPSNIATTAVSTPIQTWAVHFGATLQIVLIGFAISAAVSIPLAVVLVMSPTLSRSVVPLLIIIQSTPIVAIAPILIVSLGAGTLPRVVITCLITFFPLVVSTTAGLRAAPDELIELSTSLKAPLLRQYTQIRLPYAVPYILSASKVSVTLAVIGAVVAEFVAADRGLGYLILSSTATFKTAQAFVALLLLLSISFTLYQSVVWIERSLSWSRARR